MTEEQILESIARKFAAAPFAPAELAEDLERRAAALDRQGLLHAYQTGACTGRQMLATYYAGRLHWGE